MKLITTNKKIKFSDLNIGDTFVASLKTNSDNYKTICLKISKEDHVELNNFNRYEVSYRIQKWTEHLDDKWDISEINKYVLFENPDFQEKRTNEIKKTTSLSIINITTLDY